MIRVTVADRGSGIQPEHLLHIFEPFFTTKDNYGTGLGLWVSNELIRRNHGRIRVRSRVGRGTVFTILLPLNCSNQQDVAQAAGDKFSTLVGPASLSRQASISSLADIAQQDHSAVLPSLAPAKTDVADA